MGSFKRNAHCNCPDYIERRSAAQGKPSEHHLGSLEVLPGAPKGRFPNAVMPFGMTASEVGESARNIHFVASPSRRQNVALPIVAIDSHIR